jgi:transcriptional regulator with XRE-family HTH domain
MTDAKELFSRRLKAARERCGLSQRRLGLDIGYLLPKASIYINRWEREARMPKEIETIDKLAKVLKVPTPYFFCEDEELAEMLIAWGKLGEENRADILERVKHLVGE